MRKCKIGERQLLKGLAHVTGHLPHDLRHQIHWPRLFAYDPQHLTPLLLVDQGILRVFVGPR